MAKKEDLQKVLMEQYGYSEDQVQETNKTLEKMISEEKSKEVTEVVVKEVVEEEVTEEEVTEDVEEETETEEVVGTELETLSEMTHQLGIFTEFIYNVRNKGALVEVSNEGFGDMYVSDSVVKVGDKSKRIVTGEKVVIEGANTVRIIAASQPTVKISEKK